MPPANRCQSGSNQQESCRLRYCGRLMVRTTALILLFLPRLAEMRNMRAKVDVGKIEASGKEFRTAGRTRVDSGQAGTDRWKMKGQHWTQGSNLGHRLVAQRTGACFRRT